MDSRRVIRPSKPVSPADRKPAKAAQTQAPCKYTTRTLLPKERSAGPKRVKPAIANNATANQSSGELAHCLF
jgi:hypothetical protein